LVDHFGHLDGLIHNLLLLLLVLVYRLFQLLTLLVQFFILLGLLIDLLLHDLAVLVVLDNVFPQLRDLHFNRLFLLFLLFHHFLQLSLGRLDGF